MNRTFVGDGTHGKGGVGVGESSELRMSGKSSVEFIVKEILRRV